MCIYICTYNIIVVHWLNLKAQLGGFRFPARPVHLLPCEEVLAHAVSKLGDGWESNSHYFYII